MAYLRDDDWEEEVSGSESEDDYSDAELPIEQANAMGLAPGEKRPAIYNAERLHEILEDFAWTDGAAWEETQAITAEDEAVGLVPQEKVEDDIARELAFYTQALDAAKEAVRKFKAAGINWHRPPDYYAEMVKSDGHMAKVKQQLVAEQKAIQEAEERRKAREMKKYSKQVQAERNKEKARNKKKEIEEVERWRKNRKNGGDGPGEFDPDAPLGGGGGGGKGGGQQRGVNTAGKRFQARDVSKKRVARDKKYGFGGKKRLAKQNDARSAADMSGAFKATLKAKGGVKKGGKGGKAPRPGKSKRKAGGGKR